MRALMATGRSEALVTLGEAEPPCPPPPVRLVNNLDSRLAAWFYYPWTGRIDPGCRP